MLQYIIAHQAWPIELAETTKLGKNRKQLDNTTDPSSSPPTPLDSYDMLNENTESTLPVSYHHILILL